MPIELMMLSNHFILGHPLFLLPSILPIIRVFFQWVSSPYQVAKVLELQQQVILMYVQGCFPLRLTSLISLQSEGLSRAFSYTYAYIHFFFLRFFPCLGHYRVLSRGPFIASSYHFIYGSVYMSIPISNLSLTSLVTTHLFSTSVALLLFCK